MLIAKNCESVVASRGKGSRSHSAQGLAASVSSPAMKIPLPPRPWITDAEDDSSDEIDGLMKDEGISTERTRTRSRYRHHKQRLATIPIGIFWDIENCQVPRGCSAIDVVAAIRTKFVRDGRREADFVVVCDARKESNSRLQELNDAQVSIIHVCRTQKNASDDKLRQYMRRFGDLHTPPAAILLISGDIDFAADLSDFRYRKNMEVILVHKQNTSAALIACASSHFCFDELAAKLPRKITKSEEEPSCELEVSNLPINLAPELVSFRLRTLAKKSSGKVIQVSAPTAVLRFSSPEHASRALMRMDGEDVYGRKISTRYARSALQPAYSSDEGYSTAPTSYPPPFVPPPPPPVTQAFSSPPECNSAAQTVSKDWALALQQLPAPTPPPHDFCPPPAPKPRKIRGTHGSVNLDRSGCSSTNSGEGRARDSQSRAASPWNSSASLSEQSEPDETPAELTVSNLPPYDPVILQEMLTHLFNQYVTVVRVSVWSAGEGPLATVVLRSEWDARLVIARIHKRRLDSQWTGRRLELSLGKPSPAPNLDVLRARLRAILLDQKSHTLPLLRLRDAYASRHCCALTTSDVAKLKDTVIIHEGFGRMVQLIDLTPVSSTEMEEAPWKCHMHASMSTGQEDGSRILQPVFMEIAVLAKNVHALLEAHGGILPLLSFVECYEAMFPMLARDAARGVPLELLLRGVAGVALRDAPSRHLAWARADSHDSPHAGVGAAHSDSSRSSGDRDRPRTAPVLEPMLALFERELIDLLRTAPKCSIPFSKLIPSFHHHFGRQCRVADYGFTKLPDLLAALSSAIVVLGSGSSRIITISATAQSRRWTSDLVKLLKAQPGRAVHVHDIPALYQAAFGKPFSPVDYGVCTVDELMQRVAPQAVMVDSDGTVSLPRHTPTPEERVRTREFAMEVTELLTHTPNLRMEFSRFVPAYHAHFGRQLRVAHYGCVKLAELFELVPRAVAVCGAPCDAHADRSVRLARGPARAVLAQRLRAMGPVPLQDFAAHYAHQFGAPPLPDMVDVESIEALVYQCGGCVERGAVLAPGGGSGAAGWACAVLAACAALCSDRSVAPGSTQDYFIATYRRLRGSDPDLRRLSMAGVFTIVADLRLLLSPAWRAVWRLAQILADTMGPLTAEELFVEYTRRYEPNPAGADSGAEGIAEYLVQYPEVFACAGGERWALCGGVAVPRARDVTPHEDYSLYDTPPGQKGSRVFDSPKNNIWCSPPASALPTPTALLAQDNRRRIRLAAQFDCS